MIQATREKLLTPPAQQRLGDIALARKLRDRLRALQRREHQLGLLLSRELPVLPSLRQQILLLVGAAHARRAAGRLRRPSGATPPSGETPHQNCQHLNGDQATTTPAKRASTGNHRRTRSLETLLAGLCSAEPTAPRCTLGLCSHVAVAGAVVAESPDVFICG